VFVCSPSGRADAHMQSFAPAVSGERAGVQGHMIGQAEDMQRGEGIACAGEKSETRPADGMARDPASFCVICGRAQTPGPQAMPTNKSSTAPLPIARCISPLSPSQAAAGANSNTRKSALVFTIILYLRGFVMSPQFAGSCSWASAGMGSGHRRQLMVVVA
jgi:hypothetical protein